VSLLNDIVEAAAAKFDTRPDDTKVKAAVDLAAQALLIYDQTVPDELRAMDANKDPEADEVIDRTPETSVKLFLIGVRSLIMHQPPVIRVGGQLQIITRVLMAAVRERLERRDPVFVAEYLRQVGELATTIKRS